MRATLWLLAVVAQLCWLPPALAAESACRGACSAAIRACRRSVQVEAQRDRRQCAASVAARDGRCPEGGDCSGFRTGSACRREAHAFARVARARCDRLGDACRSCCTGATVCTGATLTVDDPDYVGALGGDTLSLTEAIALATGALDPAALSEAERAHVVGDPGAERPDRLGFSPQLVIALRRVDHPVDAILPALTDAGDSITGDGTVLDGAPMDGQPQPATTDTLITTDTGFGRGSSAPLFVVTANDVAITGLTVDRVVAPQVVVTTTGTDAVSGTLLDGNVFRGLGRAVPAWGVIATAASGESGRGLGDLWIRRNRFVDIAQAITVSAGSGVGAVTAAGNVAEGIHVTGNVVERPAQGMVICGGSIALGGAIADNVVRDCDVEHNRVIDGLDTSIIASTSCVIAGGTASANRLERLRFRRNIIVASPALGRQNSAFFLTGAQVALADSGSADGDTLRDVELSGNLVDGTSVGATIVGGYLERCAGCIATGGLVEDLRITANAWRNVDVAVALSAATAGEAAGSVSGHVLRGALVERNDVMARVVGLAVQGSNAFGLPLGGPYFLSHLEFPGFHQPAAIVDNAVRGVTISRNRITSLDGVSVLGGISTATEDVVARPLVADVAVERNRFDVARTEVAVIGGVVDASGTVADARVQRVTGMGNSAPTRAVAVVVLPDVLLSGAPPESATGNLVLDVALR